MKVEHIARAAELVQGRARALQFLERLADFRYVDLRAYFNGHQAMGGNEIRMALGIHGEREDDMINMAVKSFLVDLTTHRLEKIHQELVEMGVEL